MKSDWSLLVLSLRVLKIFSFLPIIFHAYHFIVLFTCKCLSQPHPDITASKHWSDSWIPASYRYIVYLPEPLWWQPDYWRIHTSLSKAEATFLWGNSQSAWGWLRPLTPRVCQQRQKNVITRGSVGGRPPDNSFNFPFPSPWPGSTSMVNSGVRRRRQYSQHAYHEYFMSPYARGPV